MRISHMPGIPLLFLTDRKSPLFRLCFRSEFSYPVGIGGIGNVIFLAPLLDWMLTGRYGLLLAYEQLAKTEQTTKKEEHEL